MNNLRFKEITDSTWGPTTCSLKSDKHSSIDQKIKEHLRQSAPTMAVFTKVRFAIVKIFRIIDHKLEIDSWAFTFINPLTSHPKPRTPTRPWENRNQCFNLYCSKKHKLISQKCRISEISQIGIETKFKEKVWAQITCSKSSIKEANPISERQKTLLEIFFFELLSTKSWKP